MGMSNPSDLDIPFSEPSWVSGSSSPYYNESHRKVRSYVRKFVEEEISPFAQEWEMKGGICVALQTT